MNTGHTCGVCSSMGIIALKLDSQSWVAISAQDLVLCWLSCLPPSEGSESWSWSWSKWVSCNQSDWEAWDKTGSKLEGLRTALALPSDPKRTWLVLISVSLDCFMVGRRGGTLAAILKIHLLSLSAKRHEKHSRQVTYKTQNKLFAYTHLLDTFTDFSFLVAPCRCKERLILSRYMCICSVVCPWQESFLFTHHVWYIKTG